LIFISQIVEIFPDLCYSIIEVGQTEGFRLIMVKPTIDELAALKEVIFKWSVLQRRKLAWIRDTVAI
jgi:hypothetical protein